MRDPGEEVKCADHYCKLQSNDLTPRQECKKRGKANILGFSWFPSFVLSSRRVPWIQGIFEACVRVPKSGNYFRNFWHCSGILFLSLVCGARTQSYFRQPNQSFTLTGSRFLWLPTTKKHLHVKSNTTNEMLGNCVITWHLTQLELMEFWQPRPKAAFLPLAFWIWNQILHSIVKTYCSLRKVHHVRTIQNWS